METLVQKNMGTSLIEHGADRSCRLAARPRAGFALQRFGLAGRRQRDDLVESHYGHPYLGGALCRKTVSPFDSALKAFDTGIRQEIESVQF